MEPPPFGDGNLYLYGIPDLSEHLLQWSHHLSGMEIVYRDPGGCCSICSFNGATTFRGWKSDVVGHALHGLHQASMEPPPFGDGNKFPTSRRRTWWSCFNGATTFRGWKFGEHPQVPLHPLVASMEPPPFGDGNASPATNWQSAMTCFNGATTFRGWKLGNRCG